MSIVMTPVWPELSKYLFVEEYDRDGGHESPRIRIEFRDVPGATYNIAIWTQLPCVACGRPIHPVRAREGDKNRLYLAVACPIGVRIECSRGRAASEEYERFRSRWAQMKQDPRQLTMF